MKPSDARTPGGNRANAEGSKRDGGIVAPSGLGHMIDDRTTTRAEVERDKLIATLKARCALAGYAMFVIQATGGGSAFLVQRWDRTRELPDVAAVEAFLAQAGAS